MCINTGGYVKDHLAADNAPERVVIADAIARAPNGKVDDTRLE